MGDYTVVCQVSDVLRQPARTMAALGLRFRSCVKDVLKRSFAVAKRRLGVSILQTTI